MKGKASERDPFAGYTPVKVSVPVVDLFKQEDEKPSCGKKCKFGGKRESGTLSRTAVLVAVLLVSAALVLVVAVFSFGVIYDKPVQEAVPELSSLADDIKPLAEAGGVVMRRVAGVVENVRVSLAESQKTVELESAPPGEMPSPTNFASAVASGIAGISTLKERERSIETALDAASLDAVEEVMTAAEDTKAAVGAVAEEVRSAVHSAQAREVDPRLKRFQGGGQAVRRVGEGNIREFRNGGQRGRSIGDWRRKEK